MELRERFLHDALTDKKSGQQYVSSAGDYECRKLNTRLDCSKMRFRTILLDMQIDSQKYPSLWSDYSIDVSSIS